MNGIKQRISDWQPRKLLCFSAAFSFMALLTTLCVSYHIKDWYLLLGVLSAAGVITLVVLFKEKLVPFTLGVLFGLIWCISFVHICYFPAQRLSGYGGKLTLQVLEIPDAERPEMLNVRVLAVGEQDVRVKARVYLENAVPNLRPGDRLYITGVLQPCDTGLSGNRLQTGLYLTVIPEDGAVAQVEPVSSPDLVCRGARLAQEMQRRIQTLISGEPGNLLAAMITGNSSLCGPALRKALVNSGLAHVAAVSGLHISILTGFFVTLFGKRKGYLIAMPLIVIYAVITGASPSAMRAVIMQLVLMVSVFFYRDYDPMTALFAALLCLVAQNPFASLSTSLLLSFAATFGILLMNQTLLRTFSAIYPKRGFGRKLCSFFGSACSVSLSAMVFTMPITLLIFGRASMLSLISNLLTIWVVSIVMTGGILLLLTSLISMPAAAVFAGVLRIPLIYLVWIIKQLGSLTVFVGQGGSLLLEFGAFAVLLCCLILRFTKQQKIAGILVSGVVLTAAFCLSAAEPYFYNEVQIYGNYGAPILMIRDGTRTMLIGTGKNGSRSAYQVEETLSGWGRDHLSAVICLSNRVKSTGGLDEIVQQYAPENVFLPQGSFDNELEDKNVWRYTEAGNLSVPDTTGALQLIPLTEEIWALRWVSDNISLLVAFDGQPMELAVGAEKYQGDLSADILVADTALLQSDYAAEYLCGRVNPALILGADTGFDSLPTDILGVPVGSLTEIGTVTLTTKR